MISKYSHNQLLWIDLESPTEEELIYVLEEYRIPRLIEEEIRSKTQKTKIRSSEDIIFASFYFPKILHNDNKIIENKVIFVVCKDIVLTIHDNPIDAIGEFLNNLEMDSAILDELKITNNGLMTFYLIKSLYVNLKEQLVINNNGIKEIENKILNPKNKNISKLIYNKNYLLIKIDKILNFNERILKSFFDNLINIFGHSIEYYSSVIQNEHTDIKDMLNEQGKSFNNLYNITNLMLIDKNSKKLKILVKLVFLSLIISLITFLYVFSNI